MQTLISQPSIKPKCCKPELQTGTSGKQVVELQRLLSYWGTYRGKIDGEFAQATKQAVETFQRKVFLTDDGIVDPFTWQALYAGCPVDMPVLKLGSVGHLVVLLQQALKANDYFWADVNGEFDLFTDIAVREFQKRCGLVIDGTVGFHTWRSLSKLPH
ncbi:Peptidoglycan-binding domain 1 protein [Thalassoporum mexicanum PCC 7367]|uniref:peptidoglycan-binding domain-containing protein n=1 Tax=Thalassoporum mexicanum TaxID=3457544 RepID=UPI00029FFF5A|nr:peptidoglycan-binding protein [Pseudanabaena sp. PCC 7367]AFY68753.1 Peptidoglycan-binding domain 1 protein [Pseudanabaena sp. PCC 7367]